MVVEQVFFFFGRWFWKSWRRNLKKLKIEVCIPVQEQGRRKEYKNYKYKIIYIFTLHTSTLFILKYISECDV